MYDRILQFLSKERELHYLCEKLEVTENEVLGLIERLRLEGHTIETYSQNGNIMIKNLSTKVIQKENKFEIYDSKLKKHRFAFLGDTHLASKYDLPEVLESLYDELEKRKIKTVYHTGDISDGFYKNRPEHIYSLKAYGTEEQAEYVINNYPKREGIKTYFITGNHDHTHIKNGGGDIGKIIARGREDLTYLGADYAEIIVNNCKIHIQHPGGGSSYARSYKLQKFIDSMRGGDKPHILAQGHFHKAFYMFYRNIHAFSVPSVQNDTPFGKSLGLGNDIGMWVVEVKLDKEGNVISIVPELVPIYDTKPKSKQKIMKK